MLNRRGFAADHEKAIFDVTHPVVTNGISNEITGTDLRDRALIVTLNAIDKDERKLEREILKDFNKGRPFLFGALLNEISASLKNGENTKLVYPRLADFVHRIPAAGTTIFKTKDEFNSQ